MAGEGSSVLEVESIVCDIRELVEQVRRRPMSRLPFHSTVKRGIGRLASKFELRRYLEYPVRYDVGKLGLVDVVWLSGSRPVAAFEIDGRCRKKSVAKLLALQVPLRFWVYYGCKDITPLICEADPQRHIRLIRLMDIRFEG